MKTWSFLMCFSNQNTLINFGKCHKMAFYVQHCVEILKLKGEVFYAGSCPQARHRYEMKNEQIDIKVVLLQWAGPCCWPCAGELPGWVPWDPDQGQGEVPAHLPRRGRTGSERGEKSILLQPGGDRQVKLFIISLQALLWQLMCLQVQVRPG